MGKMSKMKVAVMNVFAVLCCCSLGIAALPDDIFIGGLFNSEDAEQALAFQYAVESVNADKMLLPRSRLHGRIVNLTSDDSYHAAKRVCSLLLDGVAAIFGPQTDNVANHVQSICDAMEIPHIETRWNVNEVRNTYSINLHPFPPSLSKAYKDILIELQWTSFVILYENNESLVRVQSLMKNATWNFVLRKLDESGDYRPMLKEIRLSSIRNIVMDVSREKIYEVFRQGALVGLMTDYYRYFVTNLDLYLIDLKPFGVSGANITGIQLVDPHDPSVQRLVEEFKRGELRYGHTLPMNYMISTDAALIYDSVKLFASALTALEYSHQVEISKLYCEGDKTWQHGTSLVNYMKMYGRPNNMAPPDPNRRRLPQPQPIPPYRHNSWMMMQDARRGGASRGRGGTSRGGYYQLYNISSTPQYDQVQLRGVSGLLIFNDDGFRADFELDIVEMDDGNLEKVGQWTQRRGANFTRTWAETVQIHEKNLRNKTLIVCIALTEPYAMPKKSTEILTGNDKYEGFCIDLVNMIAKMEGFKVKFVVAPDDKYGNFDNETGEWNGIIKQLLDKKADLGIVDFTITYQRQEVVDFTTPFMNLGISIIYKKPQKKSPSLFSFMSPFSLDVWIYMATAYLGVSVLLFILARIAPNEWDNPHPCIQDPDELENSISLSNAFWFTIGSLMQQGSDIAPKAVSTRIVAGIWWFFTLIMISSYTANLAAFLTVERMDSPIESAEDLASQTRIKYGCKSGGSTYSFFQETRHPIYQKMWDAMSTASPSVFTDSNTMGVDRVSKSGGMYAFLMESVSIEYEVERRCDLTQIGGLLDSKSYGIALRPGSQYTNIISGAVLKLKEDGELHKLKETWWKGNSPCQTDTSTTKSSGAAELGLANVGGVFVVLIGGMGVAAFMAICEFMWNARELATDESASFCDELSSEVRFIMKCSGNTKPVRKKTPSTPEEPLFTYGSYGANYGYSQRKQ